MKVALVRPCYRSHIITPPLGLGYISSYLKQQGIDTVLIDGLRDRLNNRQILRRLADEKPDWVGITCLTAFYGDVVDMARAVKQAGLRCVIGGVHPTFLPQQTLLDTGADFVVCGEAETAFLKLIRQGNNEGIPGVYSAADFLKGPVDIVFGERVEDLDSLPFPDWDQMDPRSYPRAPHGAIVRNFPVGVVTTSRGCPYECTFCASPAFYDRKIRFRSPAHVANEIEYLVRRFGVREIHFEDDNLTLKRERVVQLCEALVHRSLHVAWTCPNGIRADAVDAELIALMKAAGCYCFGLGIESANRQVLEQARKRETLETIDQAVQRAAEAGILCQGFFIFGLPGETRDSIEETIRYATDSRLTRAQFVILDVLPGSELWGRLNGQFTPNWNKNSYKEPEYIPEGLTKEDLLRAQTQALRRFYLRPRILLSFLRDLRPSQIGFFIKRLAEYRLLG